ncbi:MAG: metal-sulfur cluster assembly factor [Candidatus Sericytochromatia bacterium]
MAETQTEPLETLAPVAEAAIATEVAPDNLSEATPETPATPLTPPDEESVRNALCQVIDPELHMNIVELGLIYSVTLDPSTPPPSIDVEMTLTSPGCPYGPMIMSQVPLVLKKTFGESIGEVEVHLTFAPPWDPATMASEDVKFELGIF